MLDVEFEWFDPQPDVDYHGIKSLLQQLFDSDSQLFELSALTDLILSQPTLGSTVKIDGNETDPYAFLSILNLQEHKVSDMYTRSTLSRSSWFRTKRSLPKSSNTFNPNPNRTLGLLLLQNCWHNRPFRRLA